ncbi:MAG: polysaccharide deacetylase family protein [Lishizhenia sp.]
MKLFRTPRFFKWVFPKKTWSFSVSTPSVYLTFDDGPIPEVTPKILDYLKQKQFKATFFCVGENVRKHPELFERIKEEGHSIGNHTQYHNNSKHTDKLSYLSSYEKGKETVNSLLFRPPYGRLNISRTNKIAKTSKIIMWTLLSYDWDQSVSLRTIKNKIKTLRAGDIVVLHDNLKSANRVLPILEMIAQEIESKNLTTSVIISKTQ